MDASISLILKCRCLLNHRLIQRLPPFGDREDVENVKHLVVDKKIVIDAFFAESLAEFKRIGIEYPVCPYKNRDLRRKIRQISKKRTDVGIGEFFLGTRPSQASIL